MVFWLIDLNFLWSSSVFSSVIYNLLSSSGVDPILFCWTIIYFNMFLFLGKYHFVSFLFYHYSSLLAFSFGEHYCFLLSFVYQNCLELLFASFWRVSPVFCVPHIKRRFPFGYLDEKKNFVPFLWKLRMKFHYKSLQFNKWTSR